MYIVYWSHDRLVASQYPGRGRRRGHIHPTVLRKRKEKTYSPFSTPGEFAILTPGKEEEEEEDILTLSAKEEEEEGNIYPW